MDMLLERYLSITLSCSSGNLNQHRNSISRINRIAGPRSCKTVIPLLGRVQQALQGDFVLNLILFLTI
jgi:hypothetical protein